MPVVEVVGKQGSFEFELSASVTRDVLDAIQYFGHIALMPGRIDPLIYGDNLLDTARYVGVVQKKTLQDDGRTNLVQDDIRISGVGMPFWLGDADGKGAVIETEQLFDQVAFETVIAALLPDSVTAGNISTSVSGTYSGRHRWETPRQAIDYVCQTMSTVENPVTWRVNGDGTLDAGTHAELFVTEPTCIVVRKGTSTGEDMFLRALPGTVDSHEDVEDFTTRVVMLAEGSGEDINTGAADISPGLNPYKDLHGNALKLTRMVSESDTVVQNADTRAELALNTFTSPHREFTLNTWDYDVKGSFEVGDYVYVYDPDLGLTDPDNEVYFRGAVLNPILLQVSEADWAITQDFTIAYRAADGTWYDLTEMVKFEESTYSKFVVGDPARQLLNPDTEETTIGIRTGTQTGENTSVPDVTEWVTASFETVTYLGDTGFAKARQKLVWDVPLNTDGTAITDGLHYEIQYRLDIGGQYSQTWGAASTITWDEANTWNQPVEPDILQWQSQFVGWGENSAVIHELATGTAYDYRIRSVDIGGNQSEWSTQATVITSTDGIPPSTPAAPTVAASPLAIQVKHELGKASGGTFNLENDLGQLEVHYSFDNNFTPTSATKAGLLRANRGMIAAQTPAIDTFTIPETDSVYVKVVAVDMSGNRSLPSAAASVTAALIDSQYISELTASKITAGTLNANILLGASIHTAETGARVELNVGGIQAYDSENNLTLDVESETGSITMTGIFKSQNDVGGSLQINPGGNTNEIRFYSTDALDYSTLLGVDEDLLAGSDASLKMLSSVDENDILCGIALLEDRVALGRFHRAGVEQYLEYNGGYAYLSDASSEFGMAFSDVVTGALTLGSAYVATTTSATIWGPNRNSFINLNSQDEIRFGGAFANRGPYLSNEGVLTGVANETGAHNFITIGYGLTMDTVPHVIGVTIDSGNRNVYFQGGDLTTTSFVAQFGQPTVGDYTFYWWAWRINP